MSCDINASERKQVRRQVQQLLEMNYTVLEIVDWNRVYGWRVGPKHCGSIVRLGFGEINDLIAEANEVLDS